MTLTDQKFFDDTIDYLRKQETQAVDAEGHCVFRTDDGANACAIGFRIPEGHEALEISADVYVLRDLHKDLSGVAWPRTVFGLAIADHLQILHDGDVFRNADVGGLSALGEERARAIANEYGLTYTPPCMICDHNEWLASIEATTRPDAPRPLECERHPKEDTNENVG